MQSPNILTIHWSIGVTVFAMERQGELWIRPKWRNGKDQVVINLAAKKRLSGPMAYEIPTSIIVSWLDAPFDLDRLPGRRIHIPKSYDETLRDHATEFYNGQHLEFDDVHIEFLERDGDAFHIQVTGEVDDYTSEKRAKMKVAIDTVIQFVDRNRPPVVEPPRHVDGVGEFTDAESYWQCNVNYQGHPVEIWLWRDGDSFDEYAKYARALMRQELVSFEAMLNELEAGLPSLKQKFKDFKVKPRFPRDGFAPHRFTITRDDDELDEVFFYVFLRHTASGEDDWILRYNNWENYAVEWIPDRP